MRVALVSAVLLAAAPAFAFEGHWRPGQLPELSAELRELGVTTDPKQLGDLDRAPLGAIVDLDVCSGAFVSEDGLVATAFHCVTEMLQFASAGHEDLFVDGFHARDRAGERWAGPDAKLWITIATEDVTEDVLAGTRRLEGAKRLERIEGNSKGLVRKCESNDDLRCRVANYGDGTEYELVTQRELRDLRLVYAPPRAVGYFGGDADNWRWPRHSADFAFLRAYVSPEGTSAEHHPANVAFHPEHHLEVARNGPGPGEFVMVAGYPGTTYRWLSAAEIDFAQEEQYPVRVGLRRELLAILEDHLDRYPELAPKLGPRRLNLSNDLVYYEGTLHQLQRMDVAAEKWEFERDLARWIALDEARGAEWGDVLPTIHRLQAEEAATWERDYLLRQMVRQVHHLDAATTIYKLSVEAAKPDRDRDVGYQNRDRPAIADRLDQLDGSFDWRVDSAILRYFLLRVATLPKGLQVPELDVWLDLDPDAGPIEDQIDARIEELYTNLDLADPDQRRDLMGTTSWYLTNSSGNPWFGLAEALHPFLDRMEDEADDREAEWRAVKPKYLAALQAFYPEAKPRYLVRSRRFAPGLFYPDGNGTLRVSAGKIDGYFPRDGLIAAPHTTLAGIAGKHGTGPYLAPEPLLEAIAEDDRGPYAHPDLGDVPVNFTTTLDTARGSSGSATLDAQGRFVGIIFDGNFESIASDWVFDDRLTRSIHTDVAYILWYLDRMAGATELLDELGHEPYFAGSPGVGAAD